MQLIDGKDLNKIVLLAPIGICILNADTLVAEIVNDKFLEIAGKPYDAIFGQFYWDAFKEARSYYEKALAMLHSEKLRKAFDLSSEPESLREKYGRTSYGQSLILARRLVEAGTKFVTVYFSGNIGGQSTTGGGWDTHGFNNTRM